MDPALEGLEDVDIAIRFEGVDAAIVAEIEACFSDDDVLATHAFSGIEMATVVAKLTGGTLGKLVDFFAKRETFTPKTSIEIGKTKISLHGFTAKDMEQLLASPAFKSAVKAVRAK